MRHRERETEREMERGGTKLNDFLRRFKADMLHQNLMHPINQAASPATELSAY